MIRSTGFIIFLCCILLTAGGCGYTGASLLPPEQDSIHVENFANEIDPSQEISDKRANYSYRPGLETDITRAVIDDFIINRYLAVKGRDKAALLLKGELTSFRQYALSYDKNENVVEFRIELLVDMELYDNRKAKLIWSEKGFMGQTDYTITGPNAQTEAGALKAAVKDLARRIVERTVETW